MADFCSNCQKYSIARANMFGIDPAPDIDLERMIKEIKEKVAKTDGKGNWGFSGFICEGCGLLSIGWIDGKIQYGYSDDFEKMIWEETPR